MPKLKKESSLDSHSKSLPASEFLACVSSSDSGVDSDMSSSTKLLSSLEDIETELKTSPLSFLKGAHAPMQERIEGINEAFRWLKNELTQMKAQDKELMRTFINLRKDIADEKLEMQKDTMYTSESDLLAIDDDDDEIVKKETWKLISTAESFPTDGHCFESNKRATWVI